MTLWPFKRPRHLPVYTPPPTGISEAGRMVDEAFLREATDEQWQDWLADWEADLWRRDEELDRREDACEAREGRITARDVGAWVNYGVSLLAALVMILQLAERLR